MNIFMIFNFFGGLAFFIFGMKFMSSNLEKTAGGKLEFMLKKMTANPYIAILSGAVITIAMQSSSAATVMLVGLVNSGIMEFSSTVSVIFGANIGTTLTSWILSLSGIESENIFISILKPENFSPIMVFAGVLMTMVCKSDSKKSIGSVLIGFSILLYGMDFMKNAVSPLSELPQFSDVLVKFNNPILGILTGLLLTAVIQSSAAGIGILQALSLTGGITYSVAVPIVMGQNIGTCVTSLMSCIGTTSNAKRVPVIHILIKVLGTIFCMIFFCIFKYILKFDIFNQPANPVSIAFVHSAYNIISVIVLSPFTKYLVKFAKKVVPVKDGDVNSVENDLYIDERVFSSPSAAVMECGHLTNVMCEISCDNLRTAGEMLLDYSTKSAERVRKQEKTIDTYEDRLGTYLVRLSKESVSDEGGRAVSKMLHVIGNFERLSDHALNLCNSSEEIYNKKIDLGDEVKREISVLQSAVSEIVGKMYDVYVKNDAELAKEVEPLEQVIDILTSRIRSNHISRLKSGESTIEIGFILSDILTNYERISDHCSNIAVSVISAKYDFADVHSYLGKVKHKNSEFDDLFGKYSEKYFIG